MTWRKRIEAAIDETYGFSVSIIMRTREEFRAAADAHQFSEEQLADPKRILIMFLSHVPSDNALKMLRHSYDGRETIHHHRRTLYMHYPDDMAQSKLTHALVEKTLGLSATGRGWNTVRKLLVLLGE